MLDTLAVIKITGYFLGFILIFAAIFILFSKFIFCWQDADNNKKNRLSLALLLIIISIGLIYMATAMDNEHSQKVALSFILLATHVHFSQKEIRAQGGYLTKTLVEKKHEALRLGFTGAWKSKYHWGIIFISLAILYFIAV